MKIEDIKDGVYGDLMVCVWHINDIKHQNKSLTDKQAREIMELLIHKHDANIGINWTEIDYWTNYYLDTKVVTLKNSHSKNKPQNTSRDV
jgi:hypothetical protein|tara:strand:+ start:881 stop:1150 length:270 start_codon:yes stop_codon:yes gene_type:complete